MTCYSFIRCGRGLNFAKMGGCFPGICAISRMSDKPDEVVKRYRPKASDAIALSELLANEGQAKAVDGDKDVIAVDDGKPKEFGGRKNGMDPTRYGDWEKDGRCIDF